MRKSFAVVSVVCVALLAGCGSDGTSADLGIPTFDAGMVDPGTQQAGDPCNGTVDCTPGSLCFRQICVQDGVLRFSLAWAEDTDYDIHVITPNGNEIYYSNETADGGELDVDDCIGGDCVLQDYTHVENIFFDSTAPSGTYEYWVHNFGGNTAGDFVLEVGVDGEVVQVQTGRLPAQSVDSNHFTFQY